MAGNTVKDMTTNFGKLDKFEGHDFRRWQKNMHFLLTTLKVVYVLTTPMSELVEDATVEAIRIWAKWENDDYICRGHILNGMSDSLFDVYTNVESAKELWDSLESKYTTEDSSCKILGQYTQHGLKMDESISVSSIIDKLPPSWKDFKHTLKHGKDDLSLVQLGSHLRIEESLRAQDSDKGKGKEVGGPSVNMTKEVLTRNQSWNVGNVARHVTLRGIAEFVKRTTQMLVVRERGLRTIPKTKVDAIAWWIDSGAITHVCKDHCWFKTFEPVEDGSVLYMGDEHFAPVHGKGSVALEFSSGKTVTLFNVLYVPKLRKNLVSGPVLNKCGYKQVYESDKYILSKCGVFVGFGYYNNGMFMLNLNKVSDDSDSVYMSSSSTVVNSSLSSMLVLGTSRDAIFDENCFSSIPIRPKDIILNLEESQRDDHSDDVPSETPKPLRGKRARKAKSYGFDFQLYLVEGPRDQVGSQYSYCYSIEEDPRTYNEAMQSRDAAFWKEAIDDEIGSIMENNTWVLSDLPLVANGSSKGR
ncbi:zinc finger, CCHC-type containing protein [Tanacetum coccineum]|uniref:Zinc finger, CCHC-type containing protein n=1 Tax=Tanacetum coccineum TaxID=301880 RepID=A0ABQ5GT46_9ASTR